MSKEKIFELIICLVSLVILFLAITTNVFAVDPISDLNALTGGGNNNNNAFQQIGEGNKNVSTNMNTGTGTNNIAVANNTNNTANKTNRNVTAYPDTGVDYSVVGIIVVCGISAVYAYKKIRDYKSL